MRKIQLTDFSPSSIRRQQQSVEVIKLVETIKKACIESNLSYSEINKALYLSDEELYKKAIKLPISAERTESKPFITGEYQLCRDGKREENIVPPPAEKIEVEPFIDGLYSAIKGLEFTINEPIRMSISDNELKYEFNFNGLSQEKIFEIADNVVISAAKQLVNLHKGMPYKEALEKIDSMRRTLLFSGLEPYQKQTKVLIIERSKEILEDRMKNLPVK